VENAPKFLHYCASNPSPHLRRKLLEKAMTHDAEVWVLRQHQGNPDDPDLVVLNKTSRSYTELPKKSMVMHRSECWETVAWDVEPSRYSAQLWRLHTHATMQEQDPELPPKHVQQLLNCVETQRYAFHWYEGVPPPDTGRGSNVCQGLTQSKHT
jgi:hypothetical protein